jgi:hypothetical protein
MATHGNKVGEIRQPLSIVPAMQAGPISADARRVSWHFPSDEGYAITYTAQ